MGTTVSNLKFWLEELELFGNKEEKGDSVYLSYKVFLGLTIVLGFFGLDHLYLRSPLTFLAKFIVNILFFGVWYVYDVSHALFNSDVVKLYGLGVPILGPKGIAAGVLSKEEPSKLHWNFFIYGLCLMMGGAFGLDSFLVGDNQTGAIRIILLISFIGAPIAIGWWIYHMFLFFTDTEGVINNNSEFFGKEGGTFKSRLLGMIPKFVLNIIEMFIGPLTGLVSAATAPITAAVTTVGKTADAAKAAAQEIPALADNIKGIVSAASSIGSITPLTATATQGALQASSNTQRAQTGGNLNALPYTLLGTVAFISAAGLLLTYFRSKRNVPEQDDSPPEPGVLRKPDQEKSRSAT
jgi:TM2 domain-containing membrane protein YozV